MGVGDSIYRWVIIVLFMGFIGLANTGCELSDEDKQAVDSLFDPPLPPGTPPPEVEAGCFNERFVQPAGTVTKRLDLLFVVDTSASLNDEREDIADGINAFIQELPSDVLLNVGVMLAHGDKSQHSGRLYQKGVEPPVLKSTELSNEEIRAGLMYKLSRPTEDYETDGGEAGLYSLFQGMSDPAKLAQSRSEGMFRENAALAIVFVADENDICAVYEDGITPVPDPNGNEIPANVKYCGGISTEGVIDKIKEVNADLPLMISGVLYNDPATVPYGGENEVGYGYKEVIENSNGPIIDLNSGSYDEGLAAIGSLVTLKLNLVTEFQLAHLGVLVDSLNVQVDGSDVPFTHSNLTNMVFVQEPGGPLSVVDINYCIDPDLIF